MSYPSFNLAGKISHFFTVNRPLSALVLITVIVFGLLSFLITPKQYNPEIVRPAFSISLEYTGATTNEAVDRVVYELVEKVAMVPGVDEILTQVADGAMVRTVVIFDVNYDATKAKVDLLSQLSQHSYLAKGYIKEPQVMEINPETIPIMQIVFAASGTGLQETREAVNKIAHRLGSVDGVSEVSMYGGYRSDIVIEVDPVKLKESDTSIDFLIQALSAGQLRVVSSGFKDGHLQMPVVIDGRATDAATVGDLIIRDGLRVRDVAYVYEGTAGNRSYVLHRKEDGASSEVIMLSVAKVEGTSAPKVAATVREVIANEVKNSSSNLSYEIVGDDGVMAAKEIRGLTTNLIQSITIVTAVLLVFLSMRAALVVLVAIPTTLLIVFGFGLLFDQTINRITLFALILSLGLLVDSATVVVENIYTHLRARRDEPHGVARERIIAGAVDEIGVGLLLSTVTSVVVFLPMLYISGMMGPYMGPIAFFVPVSLVVSFFVAIIVTPYVASYLIDAHEKPMRISRTVDRFMQAVTVKYQYFLNNLLRNRNKQRLLLRGALVLFLLSLLLPALGLVHFQMLPKADRDQIYVYVDLPVGTAVEHTREISEALSMLLGGETNVLTTQQFVATAPIVDFNGMFKMAQLRSAPWQATLRVNLVSAVNREESSTDIAEGVRSLIAESHPQWVPYVRVMEEPPGPPVQATLVAKFVSEDGLVNDAVAERFYEFLSGIEGVVDRYNSSEVPIVRVNYEIDKVAVAAAHVSIDEVTRALMLATGALEVAEFQASQSSEYSAITLVLPPSWQDSPSDLESLMLTNHDGEEIPLSTLLKASHSARPSTTYLEDADLLSYVTAEVSGRSIVYVVIDIIHSLIKGGLGDFEVTAWGLFGLTLTNDNNEEVKLRWGGEWEMTLENFRDLGVAMGVALFLVYAVLVAQYNSFSRPAYILVTVPLGLVGILWGFLLLDQGFGIYLTATALIGFIALIGIVVNNAIIYLEYVEQAQRSGIEQIDALVAAGGARLRPIMLTSLTTILGSLTIAGDPVWSGLAWSVVFGLSLSTVMTLVVYPTLLVYFKVK